MLAAGADGSPPFFECRIIHWDSIKQPAMNATTNTGNATTAGDLSAQRVTSPSKPICMGI